MKTKFTFAVCTYNRAFILQECLLSILAQIKNYPAFELLLVDNKSTDHTAELVNQLKADFPQLKYVFEPKPGLSHARNCAYQSASGEWVIYIDDDAKLRQDYVNLLVSIIEKYDFDCFGGMYYAWFPFGSKKWLPKSFGNKKLIRQDIGLIDGSNDWLSGGNFAIRKSVLERVGGFNPELGMTGEKISYGEEDDLQERLEAAGYKIGFVPGLIIDHAVLPQKQKLNWHLKSSYSQGKTNEVLKTTRSNIFRLIFFLIKSCFGLVLKRFPVGFWKLLSQKNYYWQNLLLDSLQPIYKSIGAITAQFSGKKKLDSEAKI